MQDDSDQRRLDELVIELRSHRPEVVRQAIIDSGVVDTALSVVAQAARSEADPALRERARRIIEEQRLGLLLADEAEELD